VPPITNPPATPPGPPGALTITITGTTRVHAAITLTFTATPATASALQGLGPAQSAAAAVTYTATCTTATGPSASAQGPSSPLVIADVDDTSTYSCVVAATSDGIPIGTSAAVTVAPPAQLPPSGAGTVPTTWTAVVIGLMGVVLLVVCRSRRPMA
jgi:hypothetical protein